jgi:hypothetical protein
MRPSTTTTFSMTLDWLLILISNASKASTLYQFYFRASTILSIILFVFAYSIRLSSLTGLLFVIITIFSLFCFKYFFGESFLSGKSSSTMIELFLFGLEISILGL